LTGYSNEEKSAITFTYDALGMRLSRGSSGTERGFVWNYALGLPSVAIETKNAETVRYYVHTPGGELLYAIDADTEARWFYHFDEIGNTLFITDDTGGVIAGYVYSPYGALVASTGALNNHFTCQGQLGVMDDGGGRYYLRARYYDCRTSRFLSADPQKSAHPKLINPYQYAALNPVSNVDPRGNKPIPSAVLKSISDTFKGLRESLLDVIEEDMLRIGPIAEHYRVMAEHYEGLAREAGFREADVRIEATMKRNEQEAEAARQDRINRIRERFYKKEQPRSGPCYCPRCDHSGLGGLGYLFTNPLSTASDYATFTHAGLFAFAGVTIGEIINGILRFFGVRSTLPYGRIYKETGKAWLVLYQQAGAGYNLSSEPPPRSKREANKLHGVVGPGPRSIPMDHVPH
jgi:RHS repeat-associated protein